MLFYIASTPSTVRAFARRDALAQRLTDQLAAGCALSRVGPQCVALRVLADAARARLDQDNIDGGCYAQDFPEETREYLRRDFRTATEDVDRFEEARRSGEPPDDELAEVD